MSVSILFPVGRVVQGSPGRYNESKPRPGEVPKVYRTGEHQGQPLRSWFFALAIPKQPGQSHWSQVVLPAGVQPGTKDAEMYAWGQKILQVGANAFPTLYQGRDFSWKVEDGDDPTPNKRGRKNAETEGFPGHWIVKFSTSAWNGIRCYTRENGQMKQLEDPSVIKTGYYVQVSGSVDGNGVKPGTSDTPGVYMNPDLVLLVGYGAEIYSGPDAEEAFGGVTAALPAGASATPLGVTSMPLPGVPAAGVAAAPAPVVHLPAVPDAPPIPGMVPGGVVPPVAPTLAAPAAPVLVAPNPAFAAIPAVPAVPAAAPPAPVRQMTAKAQGASYEQFINSGQGWTDQLLIQQGYMLP